MCGLTGIGDLQSSLLFFPGFARHLFGSANEFAAPGKDSSPLAQNENCWEICFRAGRHHVAWATLVLMAVTIPRPRLTLSERLYLPAIVAGMFITFKHILTSITGKKKVTMQYPEEKWDAHLPNHYRGAPTLVTDEHGKERCVACQLCEFICPPRAITIKPEEIPAADMWSKVEKRPEVFDIDMIRCIYCGLCEEVCPEQAIFLRKDYSITGLNRAEMVHNKAKLYELGGVMEGLVFKWNEKK